MVHVTPINYSLETCNLGKNNYFLNVKKRKLRKKIERYYRVLVYSFPFTAFYMLLRYFLVSSVNSQSSRMVSVTQRKGEGRG